MPKKIITGKIISKDKNNTAKVLAKRLKTHSKYHKQYEIGKKFLVHNPQDKYKVGDEVQIEETRPICKNKHFKIIKIIK